MDVQYDSPRYAEGRALADAYMRGRTTTTIRGTMRKRRAELRTSQEQVDLEAGYNDRIREISRMPMEDLDKLMSGK